MANQKLSDAGGPVEWLVTAPAWLPPVHVPARERVPRATSPEAPSARRLTHCRFMPLASNRR